MQQHSERSGWLFEMRSHLVRRINTTSPKNLILSHSRGAQCFMLHKQLSLYLHNFLHRKRPSQSSRIHCIMLHKRR
jgi:hypothetical protein